ncbi:MAG: c-type cytochrome [Candidatus Krumholzibacteria bacterium]|nr:c-type cytochrome [Candidatus Krumholzibacteria bacterium]
MKTIIPARAAFSCLFLTALLAGSVQAGIPDTFTNLKVFPRDIGKQNLLSAMRDFSTALDVRCTFCHVQKTPGDFDSIDWASDEIKHKDASRGMMTMVRNINSELLPASTGESGGRVRCITCHRGLENPQTLDHLLLETIEKDGVDVGIARYRELRDEYYGKGAYNFSPSTLNEVAETLAQSRGDMTGAVKVLDLGIEMNPDDSITYLMKGKILMFQGDKEGALASMNKALELDPGNEQIIRILDGINK